MAKHCYAECRLCSVTHTECQLCWVSLIRSVTYTECHLYGVSLMLSVTYAECHLFWVLLVLSVPYTECHLCWVSLILSVTITECPLCWVPQITPLWWLLLCWLSLCWVSSCLVPWRRLYIRGMPPYSQHFIFCKLRMGPLEWPSKLECYNIPGPARNGLFRVNSVQNLGTFWNYEENDVLRIRTLRLYF